MNIVIVGAGTIGFSIARLLSKNGHNVVLVDEDSKKLESPSKKLDVSVRCGSGTDWRLLRELQEGFSDYILALTQLDEVNLTICSLAKSVGFSHTIARVRQPYFFQGASIDIKKIFHIDYFISPEWSVAHDLRKTMASSHSLSVEHFAHGSVYMRTFVLPKSWKKTHKPLMELNCPQGVVIGLIVRQQEEGKKDIIIPHGGDYLFPQDEVTVIGEANAVESMGSYFGLSEKKLSSVVIVGGTLVK